MTMLDEYQPLNLEERLLSLELELEKEGWIELGSAPSQQEFSRAGIAHIVELARLNFIKNPLIKRGVSISSYYVFGRGVNIAAKDDLINEAIQAFIDDPNNQRELTSPQARKQRDRELTVDGNLFFVIFVQPNTGKVRIGTLPIDEIEEIIKDKNNRKRALYYKRVWQSGVLNERTGAVEYTTVTRYYRDYLVPLNEAAVSIGGQDVATDACIYHVKVGGFADWAFGISECYAALSWAKAYKQFLTDFASVVAALAQFAWRKRTSAGARGISSIKAKLASTITASTSEANPPRAPGSVSIESGANEALDPIKTANATTPADQGKPIKHMVATAFGLPDTFFGDTDTGNLATAQSLDRPTEFQFVDRQELWVGIYQTLLSIVVFNAVAAPLGALRSIAQVATNAYDEMIVQFNDGINTTIQVDFPSILERDTNQYLAALVSGVNFMKENTSGDITALVKTFARQILITLGFQDVDELLEQIFAIDKLPEV